MTSFPPMVTRLQQGPGPDGRFQVRLIVAIDLSSEVPLPDAFDRIAALIEEKEREAQRSRGHSFVVRLLRRMGFGHFGQHAGTVLILHIFGLESKPVPRQIEVDRAYLDLWARHLDLWERLAQGDPVVCYFLIDAHLRPFQYRMQSKWDYEQVATFARPGSDIRQGDVFSRWIAGRRPSWQLAIAGVSDKALRVARRQLDGK